MNYVCAVNINVANNVLKYHIQAHQNVFQQLVDLIGITSIMEVNRPFLILSFDSGNHF